MPNSSSHPSAAANGPLTGVLVVSLEQALAAPLATCRLADAGARVIKVERPEGDFARGYDQAAAGASSYFLWTNRGKESLVLDIKKAADAAVLEALLAQADVLVQNLAPGALQRAGFGSAELRQRHPRLITCDITGYGETGPASQLKAYDLLVQCESGLLGVSGAPGAPGRIGVSICDIGAGMNAAQAVLLALMQRERTGRGSGVSVSLFDSAADWMTVPYLHERYGDGAPPPVGLRHPSIAPYGGFACAEGAVLVISIQNDREWAAFARHFMDDAGLAEAARFASNGQRVAHRAALDTLIETRFAALPLAQALARLSEAGTAYGQLRSVSELLHHPALRTRPMTVGGATLQMVAPPLRTEWDAPELPAAPALNQHGPALRAEFLPQAAAAALEGALT